MTVYKVCRKTKDKKYISAITEKKYQISYRLGKTIKRKLMLPLVFETIEDAKIFIGIYANPNNCFVILKCNAYGIQKINYIVGCFDCTLFRKFWNLFGKDKVFVETGITGKKDKDYINKEYIHTYIVPSGTLAVKELTPIEEI